MNCRHLFSQRPKWWLTLFSPYLRWTCQKCGLITRSYDSIDRMGTRPIHPHMTVAVPGYNTTKAGAK